VQGFDRAKQVCLVRDKRLPFDRSIYDRQSTNLITRYQQRYAGKFYKDILRECELYGVDHRDVFNKTPLMLAANAGNSGLIKGLLEAGADTELTDNCDLTAWQSALQRAMKDSKFASEVFPGVHEMLATSSVSLKIELVDMSKAEIIRHGKKVRITIDMSETLVGEIDEIRRKIGVDRGALIKVRLHERVKQEKAATGSTR
jgi:hypothetical protein